VTLLAVLATHCQYTLFARQTRGGGDDLCVTSSQSGWMVARYCKTLLFRVHKSNALHPA